MRHTGWGYPHPWPRQWPAVRCDADTTGRPSHLGADHGGTLSDAAQGLAQVAAAAHERHLEVVLVDVVDLISGGQNLHERAEGRWVSIAKPYNTAGWREEKKLRARSRPLQSTGPSPRIVKEDKLYGIGVPSTWLVELVAGTEHLRTLQWFREHHN